MPQDPEFKILQWKKRVNIPQLLKKVQVLSSRVSIIAMNNCKPKNGDKGERHNAFQNNQLITPPNNQ